MFRPWLEPTASGTRLYIHHPCGRTPPRGCVVHVPAFGEEMNKSRRMAALQARALAEAGFEVLLFDLKGCGDSAGNLEDATWADWIEDVVQAATWLRQRSPHAPLWLWGLRSGTLLACEALRAHAERIGPCHLLWWQPVIQGRVHLQQFLRLEAAAALARGTSEGQTGVERLKPRHRLAQGQRVEIAGYTLTPALAQGLEGASLTPAPAAPAAPAAPSAPAPPAGFEGSRLVWIEVDGQEPTTPHREAPPALQTWREQGWNVEAHTVAGPPFWHTTEIEDVPALLECSLQALLRAPCPLTPRAQVAA